MAIISAENKQYYKSRIRRIMAFDPQVTQREVRERLERNGLVLDRKYIGKLMDGIRAERTKRIDTMTLNTALGRFGEVMEEIVARAKEIADDPMSERQDVLAALRLIGSTHRDVFQLMFDAGVFERKMGTLDITIRNLPLPEERKQGIRVALTAWKLLPQPVDAEPRSTTPSG